MKTIESFEPNLTQIVSAIQAGDREAEGQLYNILARGIRILISCKIASQDVDDVLHTAFMALIVAIRSNRIQEPEAIIGFARTIVNRQIIATISSYVQQRNQQSSSDEKGLDMCVGRTPESEYLDNERSRHVRTCLMTLQPRDREILHRFYVLEQSKEQICRELELTETSFRLAKSRAKAKLAKTKGGAVRRIRKFITGHVHTANQSLAA